MGAAFYYDTNYAFILSEQSESKDLGTYLAANINKMRRSLDALRLLGMT